MIIVLMINRCFTYPPRKAARFYQLYAQELLLTADFVTGEAAKNAMTYWHLNGELLFGVC